MIANATTLKEERRLLSPNPIRREEHRSDNYTLRQQQLDLERRNYVDGLRHTD